MSPKNMFSEILKIVGFDNIYKETSVYNLIQSIGYFLSSEPITKSLLIIDEAGRLSNKNLMHFHDLRNSLNKHTGIMLAATLNFQEKLERMNRGKIQGIPEFYSRINQWITLDCPTVQEQAQYCIYRGIKNKSIIESIIKPFQDFRKLKSRVDLIAINILNDLELKKNPQISEGN
jgi:hypothetical protein